MKLPLTHPNLERFSHLQQRPSAGGTIRVRFLGTTSLLFQDGETAILSDGFVTRPGKVQVLLGRIAPDRGRIERTLARLGVDRIDAVFCGHSHFDHALDAPVFAQRTGALLLGSESTMNLGRGVNLPESALRTVGEGETIPFGKFELTFVGSRHSPGDRVPGHIYAPLVPPERYKAWKTGVTYSVFIHHEHRTILLHGSAGFLPGALRGRRADVVYLGIGGLGKQKKAFVDQYWDEVVGETRARRVILVHWDDFFRTLDHPLRPMPYGADDVPAGIEQVLRKAGDQVEVLLPVPWVETDPFAGLS